MIFLIAQFGHRRPEKVIGDPVAKKRACDF